MGGTVMRVILQGTFNLHHNQTKIKRLALQILNQIKHVISSGVVAHMNVSGLHEYFWHFQPP